MLCRNTAAAVSHELKGQSLILFDTTAALTIYVYSLMRTRLSRVFDIADFKERKTTQLLLCDIKVGQTVKTSQHTVYLKQQMMKKEFSSW